MSHFQRSMMLIAADEFDFSDQFFRVRIIEEKGETLDGFVSQATAAGLFPSQMLVKYGDVIASAGELFAAHGARRPTPDNRYFSHCYVFLACRKSIGLGIIRWVGGASLLWTINRQKPVRSIAPKIRVSATVMFVPVSVPALDPGFGALFTRVVN